MSRHQADYLEATHQQLLDVVFPQKTLGHLYLLSGVHFCGGFSGESETLLELLLVLLEDLFFDLVETFDQFEENLGLVSRSEPGKNLFENESDNRLDFSDLLLEFGIGQLGIKGQRVLLQLVNQLEKRSLDFLENSFQYFSLAQLFLGVSLDILVDLSKELEEIHLLHYSSVLEEVIEIFLQKLVFSLELHELLVAVPLFPVVFPIEGLQNGASLLVLDIFLA